MTETGIKRSTRRVWIVAALVVAVGILLRFLAGLTGYNYDVDSYRIIADIVEQGGNVYRDTRRYNYGPVWFNVLHALDQLPSFFGKTATLALRWKVIALLSLVDVGIFVFLIRHYSLTVATIFFLNPVTIIITGYHNQFDNVALLFGFLSAASLEKSTSTKRFAIAVCLLGLSLCIKHVFFLFPLWLAFRERDWKRKAAVLFIPYLLFALSFAPYARDGSDGILHNVLMYKSSLNAPLWHILLPSFIFYHYPKVAVFMFSLVVFGYFLRRRSPLQSINLYLVVLVSFSSSLFNQYLAIVVGPIATMWNVPFALYTFVSTVYLLVESNGLHLEVIRGLIHWDGLYGYEMETALLAWGLFLALYKGHQAVKPRISGTREQAT